MKNKFLGFVLVFSIVTQFVIGQAINPNDLRNIKVDKLSDAQITAFVKSAEEKGMTQEQLETLAVSRGMPASEIQKLRKRIEVLSVKTNTKQAQVDNSRSFDFVPKDEDLFQGLYKDTKNDTSDLATLRKVYGYSLFNTKSLTFEPSLNLPTPENYKLGPGDEVIINVWGASQQNYILTISPEGKINIDDLGPIYINGLTIEKASQKIKQRLTGIYSGLSGSNPNTYAQISLGNLRSIKVNITGEVIMPGTYTLPSLASAFNALYYAGGPGINGSFRNIKVIRDNREIAKIDLYDFMQKGFCKDNIVLQDQDVIVVPAYQNRIEITGNVKRTGIYELLENEPFNDLISFSGNFDSEAYKNRIKVISSTDKEKKIYELSKDQWASSKFINGDKIIVESIIDRFSNRVEIKGAVYRQGMYELKEGLTVKSLIETADGLKKDAYMERAVLYRLNEINRTEVIAVDLNKVVSGESDIEMQREDVLQVYSVFDLEEKYNVHIEGEIMYSGNYPYYENLKLGEVIAGSGGFLESASMAKIDVARRIKNSASTMAGNDIAEIFTFSISKDLALDDSASQFVLQPFDVVFVRKSPGYEEQNFVRIKGQVAFPGIYSLAKKNERISDLINKSGGLTNEAYISGAKLRRKVDESSLERRKALMSIQNESLDSVEFDLNSDVQQSIGIDLEKILASPHSKYDMILQEGDVLEIPKQLETVMLNGAFLYPISVRYNKGMGFRKYVNKAGGFSEDAMRRKSYVLYANGSVDRTKSFLGFKNYPKIEPGAEIIVPRKKEEKKMSVQEVVSLGSILTSMSMVIVTSVNSLSKDKTN